MKENVNKNNTRIFFFYISAMAESQAKSREAKVNFDDDILDGEKAKFQIFNISFRFQCATGLKVSVFSLVLEQT